MLKQLFLKERQSTKKEQMDDLPERTDTITSMLQRSTSIPSMSILCQVRGTCHVRSTSCSAIFMIYA